MLDAICKTIKNDTSKMIDLQKLLTSIPAVSPESGGRGELKKCEQLEIFLKNAGFSNLERIDAKDALSDGGVRPNLILTIPGKRAENVWVMAHLDVVPPGDISKWQSDPWQVLEKDGKLFGRGVEDNQQGLVSAVFAAKAFIENKIVPERTVKLLFIADEEFGSEFGIKFLLKNRSDLFKKSDWIVIPDGGDEKGETIEIAEKSILWLKIHTHGEQCHGSMPQRGKNACLAASDLAMRLNALENVFGERDELFSPPFSTFQPTKRESNVDTVNIIPGEDVFYMDCRILPRYPLSVVREKIDECAKKVEEKFGVKIQIDEIQHEESPATKEDASVVLALKNAIKKTRGIDAKCVGIGGGTVGAHFRALGFDAAIWSTLDEMCHQPNEYCKIENMFLDAQTLAALFLEK